MKYHRFVWNPMKSDWQLNEVYKEINEEPFYELKLKTKVPEEDDDIYVWNAMKSDMVINELFYKKTSKYPFYERLPISKNILPESYKVDIYISLIFSLFFVNKFIK